MNEENRRKVNPISVAEFADSTSSIFGLLSPPQSTFGSDASGVRVALAFGMAGQWHTRVRIERIGTGLWALRYRYLLTMLLFRLWVDLKIVGPRPAPPQLT